jgi:hypothetical protein
MSYAKHPAKPPDFNATSFTNALKANQAITPALAAQFITWKRFVEASNQYDGVDAGGLRDVVDANAYGLEGLKTNVDSNSVVIESLNERVTALEARPQTPFPGSS